MVSRVLSLSPSSPRPSLFAPPRASAPAASFAQMAKAPHIPQLSWDILTGPALTMHAYMGHTLSLASDFEGLSDGEASGRPFSLQ